MNMEENKPKDSFDDIERILNRFNDYLTEHELMIRTLEHMERDLQRTVQNLESLRQDSEDCLCDGVVGMRRMKVRDGIPYLQIEKLKKERQIANFRKKILKQNEEMSAFKKKYLKIMDPRDMPSTSSEDMPDLLNRQLKITDPKESDSKNTDPMPSTSYAENPESF